MNKIQNLFYNIINYDNFTILRNKSNDLYTKYL